MAKKVKEEKIEGIDKLSKAKIAMRELNKSFGYEAIRPATEEKERERIPFATPILNQLTGGGIPLGQFSILWGAKSCGKTTHCYGLLANAQKMGKTCAFFDLENSFDVNWAKGFGVDVDKLLVGHFDTAENAMDAFIQLADQEAIDFVILDSVQSLSPTGEQHKKKSEKMKSTEEDTMALLARKLSQFFRMAAGKTYRANVGLLLIGQARMDLGGFIPMQKMSGGNALEHWASLIIHIRRGTNADAPRYKFKDEEGKTKEIVIGFDTAVVLDKKKVPNAAPEKTQVNFPFYEKFGWNKPTNEQVEDTYGDWINFEKSSDEGEEKEEEDNG